MWIYQQSLATDALLEFLIQRCGYLSPLNSLRGTHGQAKANSCRQPVRRYKQRLSSAVKSLLRNDRSQRDGRASTNIALGALGTVWHQHHLDQQLHKAFVH